MSFSTRISATVSSVFLAGFLVMAFVGYSSTTGILEYEIRAKLEDHAHNAVNKLDRMLHERYADIRMLSTDPVIVAPGSTPGQITERLQRYRDEYQLYSSLSFFDMNRVRLADTSGKEIGRQHPLTDYWREIAAGRDIAVRVAESSTTKQVILHFVSVVRDRQGRALGVVATRMPIEKIYELVEQTFLSRTLQEQTKVELLDREGLILYSNHNKEGMLKEKSGDWEFLRPLLSTERKAVSVRHVYRGEEEISAFERVQGYEDFLGNGWTLVFCTPVSIAFAPAYAQGKMFAGLSSVFILIVLSITFLVSRAAVAPIKVLARAASEIGKGNFETRVDISPGDEVGRLADAFNTMAADLRESERRYRDLVELLPQAVYELDDTGRVTFANRHGLEMFGYTQEDIDKGLNLSQVFIPEEIGRVRDDLQKQLGGEPPAAMEYTAMRKDGSKFPILTFDAPIRKGDRIVGIRGIGIDITERKRLEQDQQKFVALVENSSDFIGIATVDGKVLYLNDAGKRLVGLDDNDALNMSIAEFFFEEDLGELNEVMRANDHWRSDFRLRHFGTGQAVPVDLTGFSIYDRGTGLPIAKAAVIRDITERIRTEEALRLTNEELSRNLDEMERLNKLMVGRELKMEQMRSERERLRSKVEELEKKVEQVSGGHGDRQGT